MNRLLQFLAACGLAGLVAGVGCGSFTIYGALPITTNDLDQLVRNDALEPQEKRDQLAGLGIDPLTINALLQDERLGNQFGGDLDSALDKLIHETWVELTPDEVQFYGDVTAVTTYSDAEAQAIVDFFRENEVNSADALTELLDSPNTVVPSDIDETNLREVFVNTDPQDIRDEQL